MGKTGKWKLRQATVSCRDCRHFIIRQSYLNNGSVSLGQVNSAGRTRLLALIAGRGQRTRSETPAISKLAFQEVFARGVGWGSSACSDRSKYRNYIKRNHDERL
jgi:hypothetical protein